MEDNHLADETLQAFLLNEMQDDTIATHLAACSSCQKKLESYKQLIIGIEKTTPETFSFDVTAVVMDKIMLHEKKESQKQEFAFWGFLMLLFAAVSSFAIPFIPRLLAVFHSVSFFKTLLIMGTGLAVLLFLLADIRKQYKMKEKKIIENNLQPVL